MPSLEARESFFQSAFFFHYPSLYKLDMAGHVRVEVRDRRHIGEIKEATVDNVVSLEILQFDIAVNASRPTSAWRGVSLLIAHT